MLSHFRITFREICCEGNCWGVFGSVPWRHLTEIDRQEGSESGVILKINTLVNIYQNLKSLPQLNSFPQEELRTQLFTFNRNVKLQVNDELWACAIISKKSHRKIELNETKLFPPTGAEFPPVFNITFSLIKLFTFTYQTSPIRTSLNLHGRKLRLHTRFLSVSLTLEDILNRRQLSTPATETHLK